MKMIMTMIIVVVSVVFSAFPPFIDNNNVIIIVALKSNIKVWKNYVWQVHKLFSLSGQAKLLDKGFEKIIYF